MMIDEAIEQTRSKVLQVCDSVIDAGVPAWAVCVALAAAHDTIATENDLNTIVDTLPRNEPIDEDHHEQP
jgi:hypothetical protein